MLLPSVALILEKRVEQRQRQEAHSSSPRPNLVLQRSPRTGVSIGRILTGLRQTL